MKLNTYEVVLTNGSIQHTYTTTAFNREDAIILAQAEAIHQARGRKFVSIKEAE